MSSKTKKTGTKPIKPRCEVSSPAATGNAGTFFEQHVDAFWLAQLLVNGTPPILLDCTVSEVHLQTEVLGWHTDDFLVVGLRGSGETRKLVGQVKRSFTVSSTDDECTQAMVDFWKDFNNPDLFSLSSDRFALVTLRGTNTLLEHFSGLLDCARASQNGAEFDRRLRTSGFISAMAVRYCGEICKIVGAAETRCISTCEIWPFLKVLHVLSLDLYSATGQTEAQIRTLLAHTAGGHDPAGAAEVTWNALLKIVGVGMSSARSYRRNDLPDELQKRHAPVGSAEQVALNALHDHSTFVMDGIKSVIGKTFHLHRGQLVQKVLEPLESAQIVLLSGQAGSGKSGVAKDVVNLLGVDHFTFSFRAEEFTAAHFDETLQRGKIPCNARVLGALLAGQGRKVLLVESVERLLEASTRDAFSDLLSLVEKDPSWRLILTCRDYSTDLVRVGLLCTANADLAVVNIPPFDDDELKQVETAFPVLARPLSDSTLRQLLRIPYILDKALQIEWSDSRPLPQSERDFRSLFWKFVVRVDHFIDGGMPRRREVAFVNVAVRRAQALTPYIVCPDIDTEALGVLRRDSLIGTSQDSDLEMAPAHDVLEDWAILQWIDQQHVINKDSIKNFSICIGTWPAIRRAYRKWVSEAVELKLKIADELLQAAFSDEELSAHFRDDTLVSLLQSASLTAFLENHSDDLVKDSKRQLWRLTHLLRVACVAMPDHLKKLNAYGSMLHVPVGPTWACVLRLIQKHLDVFDENDIPLLLRFIEDWAKGVSWQIPYPDGAESVAAIAYWLLPRVDDYGHKDHLNRVLHVIAKIPKADQERFEALLTFYESDEHGRDYTAEKLQKIIFEGMEGYAAARDLPKVVVEAAKKYVLCTESDVERGSFFGSDLDMEHLFGVKYGRDHGYFPASAYHGFFLFLLRSNPAEGLSFILDVVNHSADWYAHPRVQRNIEPPYEETLVFSDGTSRKQWVNERLWNLYRGTSVGPHVIQSALMALEKCLFSVEVEASESLDALLLHLLKQSESAAITAVVASVATAYPLVCCETLLTLLRSRWCIQMDLQRRVSEMQAPSNYSSVLPHLNSSNQIYEDERKESDALPHRQSGLETAIVNLQFGSYASRVHEILDHHRAAVKPTEEQDENDRLWRLAIHRMDVRGYIVEKAEAIADTSDELASGSRKTEKKQLLTIGLKNLEPDLVASVNQGRDQTQTMDSMAKLFMWGYKVFNREADDTHRVNDWEQMLGQIRGVKDIDEGKERFGFCRGALGYIATVCARDHWTEMSSDAQCWCVDVICTEIERDCNRWNHLERVQRGASEGNRPSAWILPMLLGKPLDKVREDRVRQTLTLAITHAINEVRIYVAAGIGDNLWAIDSDLALRCVNAIAEQASIVQKVIDNDERLPFDERCNIDEVEAEAATTVRHKFWDTDGISVRAYQEMSIGTWFGIEANVLSLMIFCRVPKEAASIAAFERLAPTLVCWWDEDVHTFGGQKRERRQRNTNRDVELSQMLQTFLMRTNTPDAIRLIDPVVKAIDRHPDKVYWILLGLIGAEDQIPNTQHFWVLWQLVADGVQKASWLSEIDEQHACGKELIKAVLLSAGWKAEVRSWRSLEGYAERVGLLYEKLPASSTALDGFVSFLHSVGTQSLPGAFIRVANRLKSGNPAQMLRNGNTILLLENLLQRHVYGKPLELKRQRDLREAVLFLLDTLVENGSSAAFKMRDDFVTPIANS